MLQGPQAGVEDRRFDDDLRKCLAFDAITACRVLQRMAGRTLRPPKTKTKSRCLPARGMAKSRAPPKNLDARTFVLDVARLAGFHSTPTVARNHLARLRLPQTSTYQVLRDMLKTDLTMGS